MTNDNFILHVSLYNKRGSIVCPYLIVVKFISYQYIPLVRLLNVFLFYLIFMCTVVRYSQ